MAARRLIAILIVLMVFSTVAAALVEVEEDEPAEQPPERVEQPELPAGEALSERIDADAERPAGIDARVGDRLELLVDSERGRQIAIADYGLLAFAAPNQPARFELLLREEGEVAVEELRGERVATIAVRPAEPDQPTSAGSAGRNAR